MKKFKADDYSNFYKLIDGISQSCPVCQDSEIEKGMAMLKDYIQSAMQKHPTKEEKNKRAAREYYQIFGERYKDKTGNFYTQAMNPRLIVQIVLLKEKVEKAYSNIYEYLNWYFDVYCVNNPKMNVNISVSISSYVYEEFYKRNYKDFKDRELERKETEKGQKIQDEMRTFYREHPDQKLKEAIQALVRDYGNDTISFVVLEREWSKLKENFSGSE